MDFQRLFKRKEEDPARPINRDHTRETLNDRDVLVCEGELFDGTSPAALVWSNVGGAIRIKADKILGILEGRTRIKAAVLQELYPGLFEKNPNPGTEFNIPLQAVVTQLEDVFACTSSEEVALEDFDTPFGQLAREDEERFNEKQADRPEFRPMVVPNVFRLPQPASKPVFIEQDQGASLEEPAGKGSGLEKKEENTSTRGTNGPDKLPSNEASVPLHESSAIGVRKIQRDNSRREGQESLQELYLTDEPLDSSKVADLILQLPRVTGVVIMLSDGAALGGGLNGGINEALLSLTPDFAKRLLGFTKNIQGGPSKFVTFSGHAHQISLTIDGDILLLAGHEGKNLPPGLRERFIATAQALGKIYGSRS
jgi:hypothetical protein